MRGLLAAVLFLWLAPASAGFAADLSETDIETYRQAFAAAEAGQWSEAHRLAGRASDDLPARVLLWLDYRRPDTKAPFAAIGTFLMDHPDWPSRSVLQRHAERIVPADADPQELVDWFNRHRPLTGDGALALLDAARRIDPDADIAEVVRLAWTTMDFTRAAERGFYNRYRRHLTADDHVARLNRLLWDRRQTAARRMLRRVNPDQAALGFARLALQRREPGVDGAIAKVPQGLRDDPGLMFDRMRWRRQKRLDSASDIALNPPNDEFDGGRWGREAATLARRELVEGHYSEAYRLATSIRLAEGTVFAQLEFLAGWISLAFLDEPDIALEHFVDLYEGTRFPISRSRGAYWAGRAAAAQGDEVTAVTWYTRAARHRTTFYGQQASIELRRDPARAANAPAATPTAAEVADFQALELVQVVEALAQIGVTKHARPFLLALSDGLETPAEWTLATKLARESGRPREAIQLAKRALRHGVDLGGAGFPVWPLLDNGHQPVEPALVMSVIRQESGFDPQAISSAGARGMMQLLPTTARRTAQNAGVRYQKDRLTADPDYNIQLGQAYLGQMLARYEGAAELALAAYNAGPSRVDRWLRQYGDPRTGEVDRLDWIESIPFTETRNYVQRVLEAVPIYEAILDGNQLAHRPIQ